MQISLAQIHIDASAKACRTDRQAFYRACVLAVTSMQIPSYRFWPKLTGAYATTANGTAIANMNEFDGMFAYKTKVDTLQTIATNLDEIHGHISDPISLHEALCKVRGLGAPKAGFIVQLATGENGCIDAVNVKRLGIDKAQFLRDNRKAKGPAIYRSLLESLGYSDANGSAKLWADWCETVGTRDGFSPEKLSEAHVHFVRNGATLL